MGKRLKKARIKVDSPGIDPEIGDSVAGDAYELTYRQRIPKRVYVFMVSSLIVHSLLIFLLVFRKSSATSSTPFISEVTYEEEQMLHGPEVIGQRPGVTGVARPGGDFSDLLGGSDKSNPDGTAFGLGGEQTSEQIMDPSTEVDLSQAEINIDHYDNEDKDAQVLVRVADTGAAGVKSIDEILAEKPINLARNLPPGTGSGTGAMRPGAAGGTEIDVVPYYIVEVKPEPIYIPELEYPELARKAGIEGRVIIKMEIDVDGAIMEAQISQSSGNQNLDEAALDLTRRCRFKPGLQHQKPVRVWVYMPVDYSLKVSN